MSTPDHRADYGSDSAGWIDLLGLPVYREPMRFQQGALTVTPLGEMVRETKTDDGAFVLELMDTVRPGASGDTTTISVSGHNAWFADADADYVVWVETGSPTTMEPSWSGWTIWSWSRTERETHKIAEQPTLPDGTLAQGSSLPPQVRDGYVYWSALTLDGSPRATPDTWRAPADGSGQPEVVIPDSTFAQVAGRHLFVVTAPVDSSHSDIVRYDLDDLDAGPLAYGLYDQAFMAASESLVISTDGRGLVTITDIDGAVLTTFQTKQPNTFAWPCAGDGWAVWAQEDYSKLYLQRTNTIYTLADRTSANSACGTGNWITWSEGAPFAQEHANAFLDLTPVLTG